MAAKRATKSKAKTKKASSAKKTVLGREADGTVQITIDVSWKEVEKAKLEAAVEMGKEITISGFRKGKAPVEKVIENVSAEQLVRNALQSILPEKVGKAFVEHGLRPAIYPRIELVSAEEGKDWQVRAVTCEIPNASVSGYKTKLKPTLKKNKKGEEPTQQEREQELIKKILEVFKMELPAILVEEEVNARMSSLLDRFDKLGIKFEEYLESIKKTPEDLRKEYEKQAIDAITLELVLNELAKKEKVTVSKKHIEEAVEASRAAGNEKAGSEENRLYIKGALSRRKVLEKLSGKK